jgi:protein tyrosine phosphatase (PTP) superfamily phosphohydrolase (DUF442 family)
MKIARDFGGKLAVVALMSLSAIASAGEKDIYNFHRIDEKLATAGQVAEADVMHLLEGNVALVINLATAHKDQNGEEAYWFADEGVSYVNIPVIWDTPRQEELHLFFDIMDARGDRGVLVHCFANYRASAFTYLYRVIRLGVPEETAKKDLGVIWTDEAFEEYPQWTQFIQQALAADNLGG